MTKATRQIAGPLGEEMTILNGSSLPYSQGAEERLLGCAIVDQSGAAWALAQNCGIKPAAFHTPACRVAWEVISELRVKGQPGVDVVVLFEELQLRGQLKDGVDVDFLMRITDSSATALNARYYAELVKLLWDMRHAVTLAAELREAALDFTDRETFVARSSKVGNSLIRLGRREATQSLTDIYGSVRAEAKARATGTADKSIWVSSGVPKFDKTCRPFNCVREDGFIVIAGGSGQGKSVAVRQIAKAALENGQRVLSYSRETSTAGFVEMLVASRMRLDLNCIESWPKDMQEKFDTECARQGEEWADKKLFCVQNEPATPLTTVEDLVDNARAFVHLRGKPHVILVDYLQIFEARKRIGGQNREATVAYVSHTLQALQRELDVPIVVVVQLNEAGLEAMRQIKRDENGKVIHRLPKPGDLRESQAIYHDGDRVIFLYKPPVDCLGVDQTSPACRRPEIWWFQEKRRRGGIEIVRMWLEKCYTLFEAIGERDLQLEAIGEASASGRVPTGQRVRKDEYLGGGDQP